MRVHDLKGQLKKCLGINPSGSNRFSSPYYITGSAFDEKIFVSDYSTNTIVCLAPSGNVIYRYKDHDMSRPRGLICDAGDSVLACGEYSQNFHRISADGKKYHTLLTTKNELRYPCSIAYMEKEATLIVDSYNINNLSRVVRKPAFCICENKDADQLCGKREADQRLCFHYTDSTIPLLSKSEISSF